MRALITLCEAASSIIPQLTPELVAQVRARLTNGSHYGDYAVPEDEDELVDDIDTILHNIGANAFVVDGGLKLWRAELRPRSDLTAQGVSTIGVFWSWRRENARPVYGPDYAPEIHGARTVAAVFEAIVPADAINWPATIAANLALPMEREVTLRQDARIHLVAVEVAGRKNALVIGKSADVDNLTQYDMGEF